MPDERYTLAVRGASIAVLPLTVARDCDIVVDKGSILITWDDERDDISSVEDAIRQALDIVRARDENVAAGMPTVYDTSEVDGLPPSAAITVPPMPPVYAPRGRGSQPQDERRVTAPVYTRGGDE